MHTPCRHRVRTSDGFRCPVAVVALLSAAVWLATPSLAEQGDSIRIATYNASLYGKKSGQVRGRLSDGKDSQAEKIAMVVQTIRPDVLLVNEIDHDPDSATAKLLAEKFFALSQGGLDPIDYPFVRSFASNTGVDSGLDLNRNGRSGEPNDAWGYGLYEGQYAMAIFSRFPIDDRSIRTFQKFRWSDFPAALRPVDPNTKNSFYDDQTWSAMRLSSKNHVDVPIRIGDFTLHALASHPTPPVFDGPADRNGCRNHDEIRFWNDYISDPQAGHLKDDSGRAGGLPDGASFVILGDLNSDPVDGDSRRDAVIRLLAHVRVQDPKPGSEGAVEEASKPSARRGSGDPSLHTASFGRNRNMRVDFVLPSQSLSLGGSGVHWPLTANANRAAIEASDHRMVWVDIVPPPSAPR